MTTKDRFGITLPDGDYRIQESFGQRAEPGDAFFQRYVMAADIPERIKTNLVRSGRSTQLLRLERLNVVSPGSLRELRASRKDSIDLARDSRVVIWKFTSDVLERIPDIPDVESTLDLRFEALRFLNPQADQWEVWLLSSVRAGDLSASGEGMNQIISVGGRFSRLTDAGSELGEFPTRSFDASRIPEDSGISLRAVFVAEPGPLPLTVVIEDLNAPGDGAWIQDTVNVPAIGGLPQLSDIAVAQAEGGTWTRDGVTFLQVSPAHMTNPDGSIHTYFEVYGVQPGTSYDVELRLMRADDASDVWRRSANDLAFRLQFRSEMSGDIGRHHLRLELGDTKPGEYTLAVRIQDSDTDAYSLPAITDVFVAKR